MIPLRTIFPIGKWQQLRHFGLSGFVIRQSDLISLLAAMPASLQSVELSFLFFYGDGNYRNLLCAIRDELDWRERPISRKPKVIIGGGMLDHEAIGRAIWVEDEVSEFLYSGGLNPFGPEGDNRPNQIKIGYGVQRDEFDPAYKRPWIYDDELAQLGYFPTHNEIAFEWNKVKDIVHYT